MTDKTAKRLNREEEKELENTLEEETSYHYFAGIDDDDEEEKENCFHEFFSTLFYRIKDLCYSIKYKAQRIFRFYHVSDLDLWNFDNTMAKWIYPRLKLFIGKERQGYPGDFSEYNENEWHSKEEYDDAIKNGKHLGGGPEAWEKILQEMVFAFEWKLNYQNYKDEEQRDKFCKKWNIKNPYEKNIENKSIHYEYKCLERGLASCISDEMDIDVKEPEKYIYLRRVVRYYNSKYAIEIGERAMKGLELFGKYFSNLWD
jgi:hypothetical protein